MSRVGGLEGPLGGEEKAASLSREEQVIAEPQRHDDSGAGDLASGEDCGSQQSLLNLKELPRTGKRGAPQAFPHLLFLMLERESDDVIRWAPGGRGFMIIDLTAFIQQTLVKYFRHTRYASFQRQLNLYGFRKNTSGAFEHKYFVKDHPQLLTFVQRSPQPSKLRPTTTTTPQKRTRLGDHQDDDDSRRQRGDTGPVAPPSHVRDGGGAVDDAAANDQPRFEKMLYLKLAGSLVDSYR